MSTSAHGQVASRRLPQPCVRDIRCPARTCRALPRPTNCCLVCLCCAQRVLILVVLGLQIESNCRLFNGDDSEFLPDAAATVALLTKNLKAAVTPVPKEYDLAAFVAADEDSPHKIAVRAHAAVSNTGGNCSVASPASLRFGCLFIPGPFRCASRGTRQAQSAELPRSSPQVKVDGPHRAAAAQEQYVLAKATAHSPTRARTHARTQTHTPTGHHTTTPPPHTHTHTHTQPRPCA